MRARRSGGGASGAASARSSNYLWELQQPLSKKARKRLKQQNEEREAQEKRAEKEIAERETADDMRRSAGVTLERRVALIERGRGGAWQRADAFNLRKMMEYDRHYWHCQAMVEDLDDEQWGANLAVGARYTSAATQASMYAACVTLGARNSERRR